MKKRKKDALEEAEQNERDDNSSEGRRDQERSSEQGEGNSSPGASGGDKGDGNGGDKDKDEDVKKPVDEDDEEELEKKRKKIEKKKQKALKVVESQLSLEDKVYLQKKLEAMEQSFKDEDVDVMRRNMQKLNNLGRAVVLHLEKRLKDLLSLPPYRSGYVDDEEVQEVGRLTLVHLLREALMGGRSIKVVQYIAEVATHDDIERFRQAPKGRSNQSRRLGRLPDPLRIRGWDIEFIHNGSHVSSEAVVALLDRMEHISVLTRENGLVRPQTREREHWRHQYFRDAERIKIVIHYKELATRRDSVRDSHDRRPNIMRSTVVFDSALQRESLNSSGIPGASVTEGLNQVALDIPQYLILGDPDFSFILNILLNQNTSTQIAQIAFGGVLNDEFINGLLQDELDSDERGHAGNVTGSDRLFSSEYVVNLTNIGTLDIEVVDIYRMCYQNSQPGTYSPCNIRISQRYAFEKTESGWQLVGRGFYYKGSTSLGERKASDPTLDKKEKAKKKEEKASVEVFDQMVFDGHLEKAEKYLQWLDGELGFNQKVQYFKEALKKIDLAFKMLLTLPDGEVKRTAEARVMSMWDVWKEQHPTMVAMLESTKLDNPTFGTEDSDRHEELTGIYRAHIEILSTITEFERKVWELIHYMDGHQDDITAVNSSVLMSKWSAYRKAVAESREVLRKENRGTDSTLQVRVKALKPEATDKEKGEFRRVSSYYYYLQQVIQSNQDILVSLVRRMYARAVKVEGRDSEAISSFSTGYAVDGPGADRTSDRSRSSSRSSSSHGEVTPRRLSTAFGGLRQRSRSLSASNLFSTLKKPSREEVKPEKEKKHKKGRRAKKGIVQEHKSTSRDTSPRAGAETSPKLAGILAILRSTSKESESTEDRSRQHTHKRYASVGTTPKLIISTPESGTRSSGSLSGYIIDQEQSSLDYNESGFGRQSSSPANLFSRSPSGSHDKHAKYPALLHTKFYNGWQSFAFQG